MQLLVSPGDLQNWILCWQWGWSEHQWEPKQLLQPVLVYVVYTRIHIVDIRPMWCQLGEQRIIEPLKASSLHSPLWIFKNGTEGRWDARRDELASPWDSPLFRLEMNWNWTELKLGGVSNGVSNVENIRKAVYCRRDDPDILEQPRGASCAELHGIWENLITELCFCVCTVCVRKGGHFGFSFLRGAVVFSVKPCDPVL